MALSANVFITKGDFEKGAIYTRDGKLTVFRSGFPPERVRESMEQIDVATQIQSLTLIQEAGGSPPALPLGCLGGIIVALIGTAVNAARGRLLTSFSLTLTDGRTLEAEAEPVVFKMLQKSTHLPPAA